MITLKKLQLVKGMITQLVVYQINPIFKEHYKMITINLSKPQALNAATKAIHQINFSGNLERNGNTTKRNKKKLFCIFTRNRESIAIVILLEYNISIKRLNITL